MQRPSFQFYPGDWLNDTKVRSLSIAARGLWIDLLCLMHQGEPYGHLTIGKRPIPKDILCRVLGVSGKDIPKLLAELKTAEVYAVTASGVIYSKRMVRDEEIRRARAAGGVQSLMNPKVPRRKTVGGRSRKDILRPILGGIHKGYPQG